MSFDAEDKQWIVGNVLEPLLAEMSVRFGEVNQRLDRIDATLVSHAKELSAGARALAGLRDWSAKADDDYKRVLAELTDLKLRVLKLEGKANGDGR